jgi:CheY-like chemotaxis protein/predicted regulator of Ras-like GTPase activity (Roadblock/LC7/MglB family)
MSKKRILIVDDEESVLSILKNSLMILGNDYAVTTATNGKEALYKARQNHFDLIVTDYLMPEMDGLELTSAIREIHPGVRIIMVTAYGSAELEHQAHRLQVYRYLNKPLEIAAFRQVVRDALSAPVLNALAGIAFSDEDFREINRCLDNLLMEIGARCVFLGDTVGSVIARAGELNETEISGILTLMRGIMAASVEAKRVIRNNNGHANLVYLEGETQNLYALNIGLHLLLVLMVDRNDHNERLGTVWYFARQTADRLQHVLNGVE